MNLKPKLNLLTLLARQRSHSLIVWVIAWSLLALLFAAVFKDLSKTADESIKLYQSLPSAVLHAVNISTDYLTKPEKFLSGQFLTVYLLAGSIFSVFMGVNAIGAKIEDATIVNMLTKPLSRLTIYLSQAFTTVVGLLLVSGLVGTIMFTSFALITDASMSHAYFVAAFLGSAITFITFALLGQLLGLVLPKAHAQAAGSALAVFSFFINGLGSLAGVPAWLQKCSAFYYFNTVQLRDMYSLDLGRLVVLIIAAIILLVVGTLLFRRKNLYF